MIDSGKLHEMRKPKTSAMTFSEVADHLKALWQERLSIKELSPVTVQGYRDLLKPLEQAFGQRLLAEITARELKEYRNDVFKSSSAVLANRRLFILQQVFKAGIELGSLHEDPSAKLKKLSEKAHERNKFLFPDQIKKLVACSRKTKAKFYLPALIYLAVEHGTSRLEALDLKWSDINLHYNQGILTFHRTKNDKERTQFLMPQSRQSLIAWRDHLAHARSRRKIQPAGDGDYVFCHLNGSRLRDFKHSWDQACKLAGFEDLHFHDLRHTYCSNIRMTGAALKEIRDMIGHDDISMTDRYTHIPTQALSLRQQALAEHYWGKSVGEEDEEEGGQSGCGTNMVQNFEKGRKARKKRVGVIS